MAGTTSDGRKRWIRCIGSRMEGNSFSCKADSQLGCGTWMFIDTHALGVGATRSESEAGALLQYVPHGEHETPGRKKNQDQKTMI